MKSGPIGDRWHNVHWSYVGAGVPWQHTSYWQPPAEPAPTEPDRIAALEQTDSDGEVWVRERPECGGLKTLVTWTYVHPGVPWQHTRYWQPPAEPAPTEPDRIAALEQRVAADSDCIAALEQRVAADSDRIAALEQRVAADSDRIAALEQRVAADSDRIAALERRVFGLEAFKRALTEPSLIRHSVI